MKRKIINNEEHIENNDLSEDSSSNKLNYDDNENEIDLTEAANAQNDKVNPEKNVWRIPGWKNDPIYEN